MITSWKENIHVNSHDTDANGVVRASVMLRYLQECANLQMEACHPTPAELVESGRAFILSRMIMKLYSPLHAFEDIVAESFANPSRGATFNRCGRILCGDKLIAELYSAWALVDTESRRLLRVSDIEMGFGVEEALPLMADSRFRLPADIELETLGTRRICYSDIDGNRHMNNTNYPDMLCDFLPSMDGVRVESMQINFVGEAALGETITVTGKLDGNKAYFRTYRESGAVGVEAELGFTAL